MISKRRFSEVRLYAIKLLLMAVMVGIFTVTWFLCFKDKMYFDSFYAVGDYVMMFLFACMFYAFAKLYGGFNLAARSSGEVMFALAVASVITDGFMFIIICLLMRHLAPILPTMGMMAAMILAGMLWAKAASAVHDSLVSPRETVLIYGGEAARADGAEILGTMTRMFRMDREIAFTNDVDAVLEALQKKQPDAVMLCGIHSTQRNDIMKYCIRNGIEAYVRPNIGDFLINGAEQMQLCNLPVLLCRQSYPPVWYLVLKRCMDVLLGLVAMLVFSPFMITAAIAVKAYDHGPIFYSQDRLTKGGKVFKVYKFRSMRVDAEKDGVARLASQNDDRITPVGKIIRSLRIDEMPQLFCILKGDMTIVGPRPERPEIAAQYEQEIPEFALRLQAKAGLTGYAQVYGKYNTTPYNKLQMDLQYIGTMGVVTDIKIILATIKILFTPESTEGVAAGQTTAAKENGSQKEL